MHLSNFFSIGWTARSSTKPVSQGYLIFTLNYAPDQEYAPDQADTDGVAMPAEPAGPTIFTAVQHQLGLNLTRAKGPGEYLVIDHVERPSVN